MASGLRSVEISHKCQQNAEQSFRFFAVNFHVNNLTALLWVVTSRLDTCSRLLHVNTRFENYIELRLRRARVCRKVAVHRNCLDASFHKRQGEA